MPSSALMVLWISWTSSSADSVVGIDRRPVEAEVARRRRAGRCRAGGRRGRAGPRAGRTGRWRWPTSAGAGRPGAAARTAGPTMPKSSSAVRPSGSTNRFPPCRSPWKMPWIMAPSMKPTMPVRTTFSVSTPASCMPDHVVELEARQPLHHQHPPGDEPGVGAGDDVVALAELGVGAGHVEHVLGLEAEVELLGDGLGEELDQRRAGWPGPPPGCGRRGTARSRP